MAEKKVLRADEEVALFAVYKSKEASPENKEKARELLILSNEGLVVAVAQRYVGAIAVGDLVGYGQIGLIEAIEKFEPERGLRFSTYATHWIKREVLLAIKREWKNFRLPSDFWQKIKGLEALREKNDLSLRGEEKLNFFLWLADLANRFNSLDKPLEATELRDVDHSFEDETLSQDADVYLEEILASDLLSPSEETILRARDQAVRDMLEYLRPLERRFVELRFGFYDGDFWSLEAIGKKLNLSRFKAAQLEQQILQKLRHPMRLGKLKSSI
ncbi:sigma-70 family RNA polymerase sigma factor [Candidatus Gribaldobacteria bacterium]|nr:sigma-70 family RNA polymerase sigma factor [Candidatus Gribaldobacteria bacterium]